MRLSPYENTFGSPVPMASMGMATLRLLWHQLTSTPWLCDGLVLGAAVAAISSTCALAFASALMKLPVKNMSPSSAASSYYSSSALLQRVVVSNDCPECNALRLYSHLNKPVGYGATLLEFSSDSLLTETVMSFTISFVIVTFAVFLVREMR